MGIVVIEGLIITLLVITGLREAVLDAVPLPLKRSISVGIGLFIAFIGFVNAGFVRRTDAPPVPVELGVAGRLVGWPTVVFVAGLLLTGILVARRTRGAILVGIVATTMFAIALNAVVDVGPAVGADGQANPGGWQLTVPQIPDDVVAAPDFSPAGPVQPHRLLRGRRRAGRRRVRLHVPTGRLLRHHGHHRGRGRRGHHARRAGPAARGGAGAAGGLAGRGGRRGGLGLVQHHLHRVGLRGGRRRPHRPGQRGHRRAVPGGPVLHAPGADRALRGRLPRAGGGGPSC